MHRALHFAAQFRAGQLAPGEVPHFRQHAGAHRIVADDALALVHLGLARLELRLHQRDEVAPGPQERPHGRQHAFQGDEGQIHHDHVVAGAGQGAGREVAGVGFLQIGHARIAADLFVQLAVADIDAGRGHGARLQRAIGEAAGRGADIEHVRAGQIHGELLEKGRELLPAAADEAWRLVDGQVVVGGVFLARLVEPLGAVPHAAGHDEGLGLGAGGGEAARHQQFVESLLESRHIARKARCRWPSMHKSASDP